MNCTAVPFYWQQGWRPFVSRRAICPRKVSVGVTLRPHQIYSDRVQRDIGSVLPGGSSKTVSGPNFRTVSNSSPCAVWFFPSWRGTASRLPFLGRRARTSRAVSIAYRGRIPSYLRRDPKILKIPFAEDRDVRLALTISQIDTLNQNQRPIDGGDSTLMWAE